jgi:hypothetical protein
VFHSRAAAGELALDGMTSAVMVQIRYRIDECPQHRHAALLFGIVGAPAWAIGEPDPFRWRRQSACDTGSKSIDNRAPTK